jgi:hypothetical protein
LTRRTKRGGSLFANQKPLWGCLLRESVIPKAKARPLEMRKKATITRTIIAGLAEGPNMCVVLSCEGVFAGEVPKFIPVSLSLGQSTFSLQDNDLLITN